MTKLERRYLSGHIMLSEYQCPCCGAIPYDEEGLGQRELFEAYEAIRSTLNRPLRITSGFRCPKHNVDTYLDHKRYVYSPEESEAIRAYTKLSRYWKILKQHHYNNPIDRPYFYDGILNV